jgi:endothelin-converting enzyme
MKIFVHASVAAAVLLLAATPSDAVLPTEMTSLMDTTVDPCEDFYQYSCGSWIKNYTLRDDENVHFYSYTGQENRNAAVIQDIVKEKPPLIGELWDSCMALDKMTARGATPVQRDLARIAATTSKKELFTLAGELGTSDFGPTLFTASAENVYEFNATQMVLNTAWSGVLLPDYTAYLDNSTFASVEAPLRKYISTITTLAGIKGGPCTQQAQSNSTKCIEDIVIKMETTIAETAQPATDDEYNKHYSLKYGEAVAEYPLTYGALTQGMGFLQKAGAPITKDTVVTFNSLPYMGRVEKVVAALDLQELKLYYEFLYVNKYADLLGEPFVAAKFAFFDTALQGTASRPLRSQTCTEMLIAKFPDLIGKYYFEKMFDNKRQRSVQDMVKIIEKTMIEHINAVTWLDAPTRAAALAKLAKVSNLIGGTTQTRTYPFVLSRDNYFDNILKIQAAEWTRLLGKINKPVDKTEWPMSPATANSFYWWNRNQMVFPAATLQVPFFSDDVHPVQNYGAMGSIMGHELTHGFDTTGRVYDGDGNLADWWSDSSAEAFEIRAQCMRDQYSSFTAYALSGAVGKVDGDLTIGENIADNGGLSLAYDAYHEWVKTAPKFDTHGVTDEEVDKLFYLAYGQMYCDKMRDETQKQRLVSNVHAPGMWRVNGVLMNHDPFAKTFQCKAGSKMNPANKCKIW